MPPTLHLGYRPDFLSDSETDRCWLHSHHEAVKCYLFIETPLWGPAACVLLPGELLPAREGYCIQTIVGRAVWAGPSLTSGDPVSPASVQGACLVQGRLGLCCQDHSCHLPALHPCQPLLS